MPPPAPDGSVMVCVVLPASINECWEDNCVRHGHAEEAEKAVAVVSVDSSRRGAARAMRRASHIYADFGPGDD